MFEWFIKAKSWICGFLSATKFWWGGGAGELERAFNTGKTVLIWIVILLIVLKLIAKFNQKMKSKKEASR